ncbi:cytochrome P450 [Pilobolus umbonatus]|nr:cytochrome P450 [Pilobolus umbonatus]
MSFIVVGFECGTDRVDPNFPYTYLSFGIPLYFSSYQKIMTLVDKLLFNDKLGFDVLRRFDQKQTISVFGISAATALLYSTYKMLSVPDPFKKGLKEIPVPEGGYPYIGHLPSLAVNCVDNIMDWHRKNGPIVHFRMGVQHWVSISDPLLAHKVFVTHGAESSSRPQTKLTDHYSHHGRGIIMAPYGPSWRKARNAALSILAPKKLDVYADVINEESGSLVERLISSSEQEGGISPMHHFELNSLNFISLALFGKRYESMDDPDYKEIANIPTTIASLLSLRNDVASVLPITSILGLFTDIGDKMKTFVKLRDPVMRKLIKDAQEREGPNLVKAVKSGDFDLDTEDELIFFVDLLLGGTDTTATTLSWACAIMCHHRDVQDKMYEELRIFIQKHGRLPNYKENHETPLVFSAIRECLRIRPAFIMNVPHVSLEEIEVDGYIIPANTPIITCMDTINKNPDVYSNPEDFVADRFINHGKSMMASANGKIEERDQYGFGWGRRICPGIYLAELELYSAFTRLFSQCIVEAADELPNLKRPVMVNVITQPRPYKAKFTRRTDGLL